VRVLQEWTLEGTQGRLFQIAGAAEQKPRAPNEILRVTERRLAEADRRLSSAWSVPMDQDSQI